MMNIKRQRGIGLVEIMVSMVIALFLLLGIGTIFITTRSTYGDQQGLSNLQDNERLAMFMLTNVIQLGGYFPDPRNSTAALSLPVPFSTYSVAGQAVSGSEGGAPNVPDTVQVRFMTAPNDGLQNCIGGTNTTGANVVYDNLFSLNGNTLQCTVTVNGGAATTQPLVTGVSDMQVLYGVDTTGSSSGSVTQYLTKTQIDAGINGSNWANVKSVRITLSFVNPLSGPAGVAPISFTKIVPVMNKI